MQLVDSIDSSLYASNGFQDFTLSLLWPSSSADDVVRRALASVLLEDPDHRLRVAHVESLLQIQLPAHTGYTSGLGLQTLLLKDDPTAAIFHVDFNNTRVTDWRSRVVYLDVSQLSKELAAARQRNESVTTRTQGVNNRGDQQQQHAAAANIPKQQQQSDPLSTSLGALGPSTLDQIWGASPVFGAPGSLTHGAFSEPLVPRTSGTGAAGQAAAGSSSNGGIPTTAPAAGGSTVGSAGGKEPRVSLFGSSFEVPHAIASCWAAPSSCGSAGESLLHKNATTPTATSNISSSRDNKVSSAAAAQQAKSSGGGILDQLSMHGSEGSSSAGHNIRAASAAVAASRLRRQMTASSGSHIEAVGQAASSSVAGSVGGMSGCLDVSTPKSSAAAGGGGAAAVSPVNSSAGEDDAEYNEAQLLFGLSGVAAPTAAAAGGGTALVNGGSGSIGTRAATAAAAPAGDSDAANLECGVDWARIAAMHHGQQQQLLLNAHHLTSHSVPNNHHPRLSGLDDVMMSDTAGSGHSAPGQAAAAAQLMQQQQQLAAAAASGMYGAEFLAAAAAAAATGNFGRRSFLGDQGSSGSYFGDAAAAANSLFSANAPNGAAVYDRSVHSTPGSGAFCPPIVHSVGAAATAAQLAESVLQDLECPASHHQLQQVSTPHLHSSSYSSAVLSDRSSSGQWGASPAAMHAGYHMMQQQQQHRQQQQQQQSDNAGDVGFRSDQIKQTSSGGAASTTATAESVKQPGSFAAVAVAAAAADKAARSSAAAAAEVPAAAAAPRLTGWASVAARDPRPTTTSLSSPNAAAAAAAAGHAGAATGRDATHNNITAAAANGVRQQSGGSVKAAAAGSAVCRLAPAVRNEVQALVAQFTGVLKLDDFDDGVVHQLNAKRSEEEAVAAVRHIAHYDLANIQHMAAYLNHLIKHYNHGAAAAAAAAAEGSTTGSGSGSGTSRPQGSNSGGSATNGSSNLVITQSGGSLGSTLSGPGNRSGSSGGGAAAAAGSNLGAFGGQIRLASVPVSTKAMLQKLPLKVFKQLEQLVAGCAYLEWRHFDAGVVKVLAQLSKLCEGDVFEELELLAATDLSNVEYMPAYLNKRLNNKLWSRRKADGHTSSNNNGNNN